MIPAFSDAIAAMSLPSTSDVIDGDPRDDREHGVERVGRVEPPTQPHLGDHEIDVLLGEVERRRGRRDLEEGRLDLVRRGPQAVDEIERPGPA